MSSYAYCCLCGYHHVPGAPCMRREPRKAFRRVESPTDLDIDIELAKERNLDLPGSKQTEDTR